MVKRMADKEKLSALMDGELIDKVLIQELVDDQEGLEAWEHYHLIGDVLRGMLQKDLSGILLKVSLLLWKMNQCITLTQRLR